MYVESVMQATDITPLLKARVYHGRFLSAGTKAYDERGDIINISPQNLMKIAITHQGVPVVINHVDLNEYNIANEKVGYVSRVYLNDKGFTDGEGRFHPADNWAWCDFIVEKQEAVDLLDKHGWELSNSYLPIERNSPHNSSYDKDIIGGKGLHLAIVKEGRYDTKVARLNSKINNNLSNKTMNIIKNVMGRKTVNNEEMKKEHEEKHMKHESKDNNWHGKKFRDNEGNIYDAMEVMNAVGEHYSKKFGEDILDMDGEYDINGNPWTGHDLIEYFKNIKNEKEEKENMEKYESKHPKHEMKNKHHMKNKHEMHEEEMMNEEEEEEEEMMTLEEKIEKEKRNNSRKSFKPNFFSSGFNAIHKAKASYVRNNSEREVGKKIVVEISQDEHIREIFKNK